MKVNCMLCNQIDHIDEESLLAKRIKNKPLTSYLCSTCNQRISENSLLRQDQRKQKQPIDHQ